MKRANLLWVVVALAAMFVEGCGFYSTMRQQVTGPWHSRPRIQDSRYGWVLDDGDTYLFPRTMDKVAFKYFPNAPKSGYWQPSNADIQVSGPIGRWELWGDQLHIWPSGAGGTGTITAYQDYTFQKEGDYRTGQSYSSDLRERWMCEIQKIAAQPIVKDSASYKSLMQGERELYLSALQSAGVTIDSALQAKPTDKLRKELRKRDPELFARTLLSVRNLLMSNVGTNWPAVIRHLEGKLSYDGGLLQKVREQERYILLTGITGSDSPDPSYYGDKSITELLRRLREQDKVAYDYACSQIRDMLLDTAVRRALTCVFELQFNPVYTFGG